MNATQRMFKFMFRIVPEERCLKRMVKKNYYKENFSVGADMDFELAFQGVKSSPFFEAVEEIKGENPHLFKKK